MRLAIIPARAGSKRIKNKNLKPLHAKPLISYTIEAAINADLIDKIIISTDSPEILEFSKKYDILCLERKKELADDTTPMIDVILDVLDYFDTNSTEKIDMIILLQPTSPLRNSEDIDKAIELYLERDCESLLSICQMSESPYWAFTINQDNYLQPFLEHDQYNKRSQDLPSIFLINGAIYIASPEFLRINKSFRSTKMCPFPMPQNRSIDIDTNLDFLLAETILKLQNQDESI